MCIFILHSNCNCVIIPAQSTLLYPKSTKVYLPQNYITDNKRNALNPSYGAVIRFTRRDIKVSRTIMIITIIIGLMVIIKRILIKIIRTKPGI